MPIDLKATTAIPAAVRQALGLTFSVSLYGAVGTGAANDRAAIQAAIDAASAAGGGTVFFPEGTYRVDSTLDLATGVWLRGAGAKSIIQRPAATGAGLSLIEADTLADCGVADLKVDSGNTNLSGNGTIHFIDCTNSAVERCVVRNTHATTPAVVMQGAQGCWAVHNDIDGSGYGILVGSLSANGSTEANDNLIGWNTIRDTPLNSIFVTASLGSTSTTNNGYRNRIIGNTITGSGDAGIESGIGMSGNVIEGNTVDGSDGPNILVRDNDGCLIMGNVCTGNTTEGAGTYGGGIAVLDQTDVSRRISIIGNICRDNAGRGIVVHPDQSAVGRDFIVANNHCRDNDASGINVEAAPGSVVSGNLCAQNGSHGIHIEPVSATNEGNMSVTGNTCDGNTGHGIRVEAEYVNIVGNRCFDSSGGSQTHGIGLLGTQANFVSIISNILQGNATAAISDDGNGTGHTILHNTGYDVAGEAGVLLASKHSATGSGVGTTSSSFADIDATEQAITLTVPRSGAVLIRATARVNVDSGTSYDWNLREGGADVSGTPQLVMYHDAGGSVQPRVSATWKLTGLTAGASKTYKLGHARTAGSGTAQIARGATEPVTIEAWSG